MLSDYSPGSGCVGPNTVLVVSAHREDHDSLRSSFRGSRWELQGAWTVSEGLRTIRRNPFEVPVVICQHSLPDGGWKVLLAELDAMAVRPSLIVSSRLADDRLWVEVLNLGAVDLLLGAPFEREEVLRVTQSAWYAWNRTAPSRAVSPMGVGSAPALAAGLASAQAA